MDKIQVYKLRVKFKDGSMQRSFIKCSFEEIKAIKEKIMKNENVKWVKYNDPR